MSITRTYGICRQDPESCGALLECLGLANPERIGSWLYPHAPTIHQQYIPDTQPRVVWSCCTARAPARHNSTPELRTCPPDFPFRGAQTLPVGAVHSEGRVARMQCGLPARTVTRPALPVRATKSDPPSVIRPPVRPSYPRPSLPSVSAQLLPSHLFCDVEV